MTDQPGEPNLPQCPTRGSRPAWLVVVGSSAGGIEALGLLLGGVPPDLSAAYVVAQHLSPSHSSPLAELLGRESTLPVEVATDGAPLTTGTVYVVPPDADVRITDDALALSPTTTTGPKPSIDTLFRSAALAWGDHAIAIVLSGTGTDGADGVTAIHSAGGVTIAQQPDTAPFDGMPRAAAATGAVDLVLAPEAVGDALARLFAGVPVDDATPAEESSGLAAIVGAVRTATGLDFSGYKENTLRRQVERRKAITGAKRLADYATLVAADRDEARALAARMLVSVTEFFRDPSAWDALRTHLRALLASTAPDEPIRVWVPGCATGEEAYTVAMVLAEELGRPADLSRRLKIFATDLDDAALDVARRARYGQDAVEPLPTAVREAWLLRSGSDWEIAPGLRECVVFARHDITADPPFPRVHLVTLRNTLIYFNADVQARVLRLCHFALLPGGLLLLGESERAPAADPRFATLDSTHHIYRRTDDRDTASRPLPAGRRPSTRLVTATPATILRPTEARTALLGDLLGAWAPPTLVIDARDEVIEVIGDVSPWCWVAEGPYSNQVTALLRDDLQPVVRTLLLQLHHGTAPLVHRTIRVDDTAVPVTARRLTGEHGAFAAVSFGPDPMRPGAAPDPPAAGGRVPEEAFDASALLAVQSTLQATIEDLSAANDEMQTLNEELQASTEELQASTEELAASNEELEATNEELSTLNQELQVRDTELAATNTDLENVQRSLNSGLVLLDEELRVRRFNALAVRLFALIDTDIGRPLTTIPTTAPIPTLTAALDAVVAGGGTELIEIPGPRAEFLLQVQPYYDAHGVRGGVMVVFTDVTRLAEIRHEADQTLRDLGSVVDSIDEVVWMIDATGALRILGSPVESVFGLDRAAVLADPSLLVAAVHPDDRERIRALHASTAGRWHTEYRILRPDGTISWIRASSRTIEGTGAERSVTIGSALDVTDRRTAQAQAESRQVVLDAVFQNSVFGVVALDDAGRITMVNTTFAMMTGYGAESLVGMDLATIARPDDAIDDTSSPTVTSLAEPGVRSCRLVTRDGDPHWVTLDVRPIDPPADTGSTTIVIVHDITRLHQTTQLLAAQARFDAQTGLANRDWFNQRLVEELSRAERAGIGTALLWIDLDGFKEVNDQHGHAAGDIVLHEVAVRLQALGRREDIVGRIGGDEFAVLVTDVAHAETIETFAERLLAALRRPIEIGNRSVIVAGSIGIAVAPTDGPDAETLLQNADAAMYDAKQHGRDCSVFFEPRMNEIAARRAERRHLLADALRHREFVMHYQPIVDARTGSVRAAEALVRWQRGDELVAAGSFIDLAEETGLIRGLGHQVLELVTADLGRLASEHGFGDLPIAINLSAQQLEERAQIELLRTWDVAGGFGRLIAEVTEAGFVKPDSEARETLQLLHHLGTTIAIDDFGTGYSNLALLEQVDPDIIKLDQSLLRRAVHDGRGHALLGVCVELAHYLDATVVLEGVETEEERCLAVEIDVDWVQGYFIARPMPLDELGAWLVEHP